VSLLTLRWPACSLRFLLLILNRIEVPELVGPLRRSTCSHGQVRGIRVMLGYAFRAGTARGTEAVAEAES
jgi:hypothetical protein